MRRGLARAAAVLVTAAATVGVPNAAAAGPLGRDGKGAVCAAAEKTLTAGLQGFLTTMEQVVALVGKGDLARADASVKDAGARLVSLGGQLRKDGGRADDAALKTAVSDLGAELEQVGRAVGGVGSLQNFDTSRLDKLAGELGTLCGRPVPRPSLTFLPPPGPGPTS